MDDQSPGPTPTSTARPSGPSPTPSASATARPSPTPTYPTDALIAATVLRVRLGPGVAHPAVGGIGFATPVALRGRDHEAGWFVVEAPDGTSGWSSGDFLDFRVDRIAVPTVATPSPPPPPTATPVPMDPGLPLVLAPPAAAQGEVVAVRARAPGAAQAVAAFDPLTLPMFPIADGVLGTIVPLPLDAPPGPRAVHVTVVDAQGDPAYWSTDVEIRGGGYPTEFITLTEETTGLLDEELRAAETARLAALWTPASPEKRWTEPWRVPITGTVASAFGSERTYRPSGVPGRHTGVDLRSAPGQPVLAPAPGRVVLAEALTVRGNTVLLDHGWGVYSAYFHMSELLVAPGDEVRTGAALGAVGATGLVTGPHLHWEIRVHGQPVHPGPFLRGVGANLP